MPVEISPDADEDIIELYATGVENFGVATADRYLDSLYDRFDFLEANPGAGRMRLEFSPPVRVFPHHPYIVIYSFNGDLVTILRVLHGHQDLTKYL